MNWEHLPLNSRTKIAETLEPAYLTQDGEGARMRFLIAGKNAWLEESDRSRMELIFRDCRGRLRPNIIEVSMSLKYYLVGGSSLESD